MGMSLNSVRAFFQALQLDVPILETEANTATVALAAAAHGVEPGRIAKTLAFKLADGREILLVARGDARIDNAKFKTALGKGKMLATEVVAEITVTPWAACVLLDWPNPCPFTWTYRSNPTKRCCLQLVRSTARCAYP